MDATEFWKQAYQAIAEGLITKDQALAICRPGTRKGMYWGKNIRILQNVIKDAEDDRNQKEIHCQT
jgi:hypothetical protein